MNAAAKRRKPRTPAASPVQTAPPVALDAPCYKLVACFGPRGEEERVLGSWPEMPGPNTTARLLQAAGASSGHVTYPDPRISPVRRYPELDKFSDD